LGLELSMLVPRIDFPSTQGNSRLSHNPRIQGMSGMVPHSKGYILGVVGNQPSPPPFLGFLIATVAPVGHTKGGSTVIIFINK